jgi:hypothetical protein
MISRREDKVLAQDSLGPEDVKMLLRTIAIHLQGLPASDTRALSVAARVMANNTCVAQASLALLRMDHHPDTFDAWCRGFASLGDRA